jgi:putative ABC transport system permease protein
MRVFGYFLDLAVRSLKRDIALTALMVLAIAIGIGACMTALTVLHVLSGDPLPGRSARLYHPQLDPRPAGGGGDEPYTQLSWVDGMNLLHARRASRQALVTGGSFRLESPQSQAGPMRASSLYTSADFFAMLGAPFRYGHGWSAADDEAKARLIVLGDAANRRLFGGRDSTGQTVVVDDTAFRVAGVLAPWRVTPRFYNSSAGDFGAAEDVYVPLTTSRDLDLHRSGSIQCWDRSASGGKLTRLESMPCAWLHLWVELDSPAEAAAYRQYLVGYSREQQALGRFQRPPNVRLRNVPEWLDHGHAVPGDVRLQAWLALGFLLVCLVNAVGLMLAKFLRRAGELGVRRALGASRKAVFAQLLVEAGVTGLAGGAGGLLLAWLGLWLVRRGPSDYAALARLDWGMLLATFALAVAASLAVGLLPAWRACQVAPALELKTQ